jgi:hypothetical protein
MLTTLGSRKRFFILPALALCFLLFGAHGLHPYLHHHSRDLASHRNHSDSHGLYNPYCFHRLLRILNSGQKILSQGAAGDIDGGSCPICDFLATCSLVQPDRSHLTVSLHYLFWTFGLLYEFHPLEKRQEFFTRGPPVINCP